MKKNSTDSRKAHAMLTVSRVLVYALLIFLSILCLFSFYMLIVNASRTNADLQGRLQGTAAGAFPGESQKRMERQLHQHPTRNAQQLCGRSCDGDPVHLFFPH